MCEATFVIRNLQNFFECMGSSYSVFSFEPTFQIKFIVDMCKCAANEFIKNKENSHPLAGIRGKKSEMLVMFKNEYREIGTFEPVEWICADILKSIERFLATNLGRWIQNLITTDVFCGLNNKQHFFNKILVDIGTASQLEGFSSYINYLDNEDNFIREKIKEYLNEVLKNKLEKLLEHKAQERLEKVCAALTKLVENKECDASFSSWNSLVEGMKKMGTDQDGNPLYHASGLHILKEFKMGDFKHFTNTVLAQLSQPYEFCRAMRTSTTKKKIAKENFDSFTLISHLEHTYETANVVNLFFEKLVGCREHCPFCRAPCCYENANHAFQHNVAQHRPLGVIGTLCHDSGQLVTYNCQSAKSNDLRQISTHKICPNDTSEGVAAWSIPSDSSTQTSVYWKWFMGQVQWRARKQSSKRNQAHYQQNGMT